ncbi:MAG: creatininase family protein [Bacteroidales bacterium]|nr:creatininase family protein [Bacteroidales bacterium]
MYSKYDITTAKWGEVKQSGPYQMAILPWGATEPHNYHLPYCTDVLASQAIAFEVAAGAAARGVNVMVLPGVPFGSQNPGQTDKPFCIHTSQATQAAILRDIVVSLRHQKIDKLLIINGHGGNSFKGMIRDLAAEFPDFTVCASEWFAFIPRKDYFDEAVDDHAGEQETSVMLHYYPDLVRMDLAGKGEAKSFAIEGLNRKVGWIPRNWSAVTEDTGVGYPGKSTAEKGKAYAAAVVARYVDLVVDLCTKPLY